MSPRLLCACLGGVALLVADGAWAQDRQDPASEPDVSWAKGGNPDQHDGRFSLELNPAALIYNHLAGDIEIMPVHHHALVLGGFWLPSVTVTDPITGTDSKGNPVSYSTTISGFGAEVGYRYYAGALGPHGLFIGPSLLLGWYDASLTRTGQDAHFTTIGGALDVGYQAIIAHVLLGLGVGVQYTVPSSSRPSGDYNQPMEPPTAQSVEPRVLAVLGYVL